MTSTAMVTLVLPFPPSVNSIWRSAKNRVYISDDYKAWKKDADDCYIQQKRNVKPIAGPYKIKVTLSRNERHPKTDLDNRFKVISDALQRWNVIEDDCKCERIEVAWGELAWGCLVEVEAA